MTALTRAKVVNEMSVREKMSNGQKEPIPFFLISMKEREGKSLINNFKDHLRKLDPELYEILYRTIDAARAREELRNLLNEREASYHALWQRLEDLERVNALNCVQILKNFISERNESIAGCSVLEGLLEPFLDKPSVEHGYQFYVDILNIIKGSLGQSGIYRQEAPNFKNLDNAAASTHRSDYLDGMALRCWIWMHKYPHGLQKNVIRRREENKKRILGVLGGDASDWNDYNWHRRNTIRNVDALGDLIELKSEEREAISFATSNKIPFGITPYYVSLMDKEPSRRWDHAVRAQVIPTMNYLEAVVKKADSSAEELDFMKEGQTSPVPLVTRRYPMIAIMKPYNSCAQICVYCQRNWEIKDVEDAAPNFVLNDVERALNWFEEHPMVKEILITGGDPGLLRSEALTRIMGRIAKIRHITRIRLGTRLPVVLPMRFHEDFIRALLKAHDPPHREVSVVTHVEHPYEITPELVESVQAIRKAGMSVYNQQVFTIENSRRFETALLRDLVKLSGIDPYYTFNAKGKEETGWFRVPIARILQERKEEARLLPGLSRTDEPVFNIPSLGKNHLRAWQHHDLISITPKGERVYEFHPWEKNIALASTYIHRDVPLMDYLDRLGGRGEDPGEYWSIWNYF